ncbi:hypothetical protein A4R35_11270 [Thermogemmatispora tikiterensis]|uniref:Uncharacterized protein n=1 Tax=Thermogemmatispora tikiterensis TaxID=1825093 RepID=A0A328VPJ8_9CHLR|nr:hypothetical protein A4R35_11270 [Thermogemmatispora tikiterensis]
MPSCGLAPAFEETILERVILIQIGACGSLCTALDQTAHSPSSEALRCRHPPLPLAEASPACSCFRS